MKLIEKIPIPRKVMMFLQLTILYSYATIDLFYNIIVQVDAIGFESNLFNAILPLAKAILSSPYLRPLFNSPEKMYVISYMAIEMIVIRPVFNIDGVIRFHTVFVLIFQILQGYIFLLWDLLFNRQISKEVTPWMFDDSLFSIDVDIAGWLFLVTFFISCLVYIIGYIQGLQGLFVNLGKPFNWLTDSAGWIIRYRRTKKTDR